MITKYIIDCWVEALTAMYLAGYRLTPIMSDHDFISLFLADVSLAIWEDLDMKLLPSSIKRNPLWQYEGGLPNK